MAKDATSLLIYRGMHALVVDERKKVRRFMDGLVHRYHGPVTRVVQDDTYSEVVDIALCYESYQERDIVERERKRPISIWETRVVIIIGSPSLLFHKNAWTSVFISYVSCLCNRS